MYNKHMHVYEPKVPKHKRNLKVLLSLLIVIGLVGTAFVTRNYKQKKNVLGSQNVSGTSSASTTLKYLNGYELQKVYDTAPKPNTTALKESPTIIDTTDVDKRIQQIAESRGYKLQKVPTESLTEVDGHRLQPLAADGWSKLKKAAQADKIPLSITAGYVSIADQRDVFVQLLTSKVDTGRITSGQVDNEITYIVRSIAPPGYTRNQTGYAINIACGDRSASFANSTCSKWLNSGNYIHARQAGFLPSYAEGVGIPSPNPNEAQYVWVGTALSD